MSGCLSGPGRAADNQHLALAAACDRGSDDLLSSPPAPTAATASEDAGTALVDSGTIRQGRQQGSMRSRCLTDADSGSLVAASGDLIRLPGPTNVMDLMIGCRDCLFAQAKAAIKWMKSSCWRHDFARDWERGQQLDRAESNWQVSTSARHGRRWSIHRHRKSLLIHAIAHIEFNTINLACDAVFRFRDVYLKGYYDDWVSVAAEEAEHFRLLREGCAGGRGLWDFAGHSSLWDMAMRTAGIRCSAWRWYRE